MFQSRDPIVPFERQGTKAPDFSGLEMHISSTFNSQSGVVPVELDKYSSEIQKSEAFVMKQTRLLGEEVASAKEKQNDQ